MKWAIRNLENEVTGEIELRPEIFDTSIRSDILHRMVRWQLAKVRAGTHSTKEIWAVSGTTKKPHKQKGTGKARQGSLRSPHMRGGAVVFGPHPRDHSFDLPKKVRRLAIKSALSSKYAEGNLIILDRMELNEPKAKVLFAHLKNNGWDRPLFIGGSELSENFLKASQNLENVHVLPQQGANVYSILKCKTLILSIDAVHHLEARLG